MTTDPLVASARSKLYWLLVEATAPAGNDHAERLIEAIDEFVDAKIASRVVGEPRKIEALGFHPPPDERK